MAQTAEEKTRKRLHRYRDVIDLVDAGEAPEQVERAVRLLRQGLNGVEIAERMGLSKSRAFELFTDPLGVATAERKRKRFGLCADCGKKVYNAGSEPPERCWSCFEKLNAERDAEIIVRWNRGENGEQIGAAMGLTPDTVRGVVQSNRDAAMLHRRRNRVLWDDIERLWNEGLTQPQIAARLAITKQDVAEYLRKMRLAGRNVPYRISDESRANMRRAA